LGEFDRDSRNSLWRQSDIQIDASVRSRPRMRLLPPKRCRLQLLNSRCAQVFRLSHGLPQPARICVIVVDSLNPRALWRRRGQQAQIHEFGLNRSRGSIDQPEFLYDGE
jgi:hypothetical protein